MMPPPPRPSLSARNQSRHNRQISTSTLSEDPDADGDAEGEAAEGEGDEAADDTLYCFCQQKSYGEMIGCDNEECEYEWVSRGVPRMGKSEMLTPVPSQMRQPADEPGGHMVLPSLRAEAGPEFERWDPCGAEEVDGKEEIGDGDSHSVSAGEARCVVVVRSRAMLLVFIRLYSMDTCILSATYL
jgi:hypothetical protein